MTRVAEYIKDNGVIDALGTNTIAITSNSPITAVTTGMTLTFRAAATNTTAVTLNLNGLGGKDIRKIINGSSDAVPLTAGDINIKGIYVVHYDATANAGAGAWILINPLSAANLPLTGGTLTGGLLFNTPFASGAQDNANHISLFSTTYGFNVQGAGALNYNSAATHVFYSGSTLIGTLGASGLALATPLAIASGGTGANNAAGAVAAIGAQPALGFTPVTEGNVASGQASRISIGYRTDSTLGLKVGVTDFNNTWPINITGAASFATSATTATNAGNANTLGGSSLATINASIAAVQNNIMPTIAAQTALAVGVSVMARYTGAAGAGSYNAGTVVPGSDLGVCNAAGTTPFGPIGFGNWMAEGAFVVPSAGTAGVTNWRRIS